MPHMRPTRPRTAHRAQRRRTRIPPRRSRRLARTHRTRSPTTTKGHPMIPEQALKAGAYAMFKRSIETLPPEKQALYGSWYEHNEAGANEEFEIAAGIIIQAALPHIEAALRKQIAAEQGAPAANAFLGFN